MLAEDVLAQLPELGDEETVRLIYEEVSLRRESGENVATTEVVKRYPRYKDELEVLLGCDRMLRPFSRVALFPTAPAELGPFRLLAELGRGASGMTYLAAEPALGGRLVVLKVIPDDEQEHLSLARLQHTHIIPLFSEQSFPDRGLRALCMPYLRGTSLDRVLDLLALVPPDARRGHHLVEALDQAQANFSPQTLASFTTQPASEGPYRRFLHRASYVEAVCWIVACLADGLQCAHAHGLVHLDLKPSNVLIAGDGLPMLLDFHLARRPIGQGEHVTDRLGGTPGWMAPEHRAAMDAVSRGEAVSQPVDERADIFALGLLLREALAGPANVRAPVTAHDEEAAGPRPRQNSQVSAGLADIVAQCLAMRPRDRYQSAAALADDLRRHMSDLPLAGVANRSLAEAWRKWRRRRPAALSQWVARLAIVGALAVALSAAQMFYRQRLEQVVTALDNGQRLRLVGSFDESVNTLRKGLEQAKAIPAAGYLRRSLDEQLALALRGQTAAALHELAERVRFRYGALLPAAEESQAQADKIGAFWSRRDHVLAKGPGALDSKTEQSIKTDLLDLAIAFSELRARQGLPRDALRILDEAEASCGPSHRIELERRIMSGGPDALDRCAASSAIPHYDLGRAELRAGRFREAARELEHALAERPQDFWPNFYTGLCAYRLGRFDEALSVFRVCVALAPDSAECYFNRARAAQAMGRLDEAARDYTRAVVLDPNLTPALLNRAALAYKKGRYDEAISDLGRALGSVTGSVKKSQVQYNLALAQLARGDRAAALASLFQAANRGHHEAAGLLKRLRP
jgi:serine/threonine protein kinase/Flp pilus assembly protein TadD